MATTMQDQKHSATALVALSKQMKQTVNFERALTSYNVQLIHTQVCQQRTDYKPMPLRSTSTQCLLH
jgi:hypothetical protein